MGGCKQRLATSNFSRKWGEILLYLYLSPYLPGCLLWVVPFERNMGGRGSNFISSYRNCFSRVCATLGADVLLRGKRYVNSILYPSFFITFCVSCLKSYSPFIFTSNWLFQPFRSLEKFR